MVGWENGDKAEPSAGSAENQIPIFPRPMAPMMIRRRSYLELCLVWSQFGHNQFFAFLAEPLIRPRKE
jgi:hypothetical protein